MKKVLIWFGSIFLVIILTFIIFILLAKTNSSKVEPIALDHVETTISRFSEFSREPFEMYWGEGNKLPEAQKVHIVNYYSQFGSRVKLMKPELVRHVFMYFFSSGFSHTYTYDVKSEYTSGPILFRVTILVKNEKMQIQDFAISPISQSEL